MRKRYRRRAAARPIAAIDVFCGAGGLSYGLKTAGIDVVAGIDIDPRCEYPFEANVGAEFIEADVREVTGDELAKLYPDGAVRLLAGCAPCRPFSPWRRGEREDDHDEWGLLDEFARLVDELRPELVTMENVPDLQRASVFKSFVAGLATAGYDVAYQSVECAAFGLPQRRRRLVLVASRIGTARVPKGRRSRAQYRTVEDAIGSLPPVAAGDRDANDRLHRARNVSKLTLQRLQASRPGGTWRDWPEDLRAACHRKATGASYQDVYSRMRWDEPSPTITTYAYSFGSGRFGHPEQDRSITLREAAILQGFPRDYRFVRPRDPVHLYPISRLIGNAVPPPVARQIGRELMRAAAAPAPAR